jgi:single-stranded DNA-binding protein
MSLDLLASGSLIRDPQVKTSSNGNAYTAALLSVATGGEDRQIVSVIAWGSVGEKLARFKAGDSISVTGPAKLGIYEKNGETRPSLSVTANGILSAYEARKRRGDTGDGKEKPKAQQNGSGTRDWNAAYGAEAGFDDDIAF